MQSNEIKVTSFRVSQEVKEHIQRLTEQRQLSTNQLFEQLIKLAEQQAPDPLIIEENTALEAALNQVLALFSERAARLESQQKEHKRVSTRYKNTVQYLEQSVIAETEQLKEEYEQKFSLHKNALTQLQDQINQLITEKKLVEETFEIERNSFKEELKEQKKRVFQLENELKTLEQERSHLNRQNQNLMDVIDEVKSRTHRNNQLKEENQKLHLEVQILRREKETFEVRLQEQIELAVLRERNMQSDRG
ncbi:MULTISPECIES: hypothetical protein [unclassified Exiguobacterium]|uniref:hypothetical protein n=1 Tax=unclassified Exiguobacterium TaxID=2644629 RepID=UPI001359E9D8|nr:MULTISPECIES: hypothetical protein [unclassified Exiguobacterium]